ncbi:MAG: polysaccharide biosynthesis protein, partial [Pseudomonadota bacterium]
MFDRLFRRRGANAAHNLSPIPRSSHQSHPILSSLDADCQELLGREPRKVDLAPARALIEDSCVLITGAGGTIGSELCRQVVQMKPRRLIMADNGEFNLYTIDQELNEAGFGDLLVPQLIDVCQREHVQTLFRKHKPSLVLHAAALKHVP